MPDAFELSQFIAIQKVLFSSLRLKEVIDNAIAELTKVTDGAAIALFLSDNKGQAFKLLASAGYSQSSVKDMQLLPFTAPSLLSLVKEKEEATSLTCISADLLISSGIMQREASQFQLALPLIASNVFVGALLIDSKNSLAPEKIQYLGYIAQTIAVSIATSILYGRSEYERERFSKLHKTITLLKRGSLNAQSTFQTLIDTASFLANTPSCALLIYNSDKDLFTLGASMGLAEESLSQFDLKGAGTITGSTLKLIRTEYVGDCSSIDGLPRAVASDANFQSLMALPLVHDKKPLGVICVFSTVLQAFNGDQIELLESLKFEASKALSAVLEMAPVVPPSPSSLPVPAPPTPPTASASTNASTAITSSSLPSLSPSLSPSQPGSNLNGGLYDREQFDQLLSQEVEHADKQSSEMGLLLVAIDDLNVVNGVSNEAEKKEINEQVVKIIRESVRDQDKACLFGDKHFAMVLPEMPHESVLQIAERLNAKVRKSKIGSASIGEVTVSIGSVTYPLHASDAARLLESCEQALLVAKYHGRDKVREPYSSDVLGQNSPDWHSLVEEAKLDFANKGGFKDKTQLTQAPDYAPWLAKDPVLAEREATEK